MLDNYYKARNLTNDSFFTDPTSKETLGPEISTLVGSTLIRQGENILKKDNLTLAQRTEVEAIYTICSPEQKEKFKEKVNGLDSKCKKTALQIMKEVEKRK